MSLALFVDDDDAVLDGLRRLLPRRLGSLVTLPGRPGAAAELRCLLDDDASDAAVAHAVGNDLAFTVKVLQLAARGDVHLPLTVDGAVASIGVPALRDLAIRTAVFEDRVRGWAATVAQVLADYDPAPGGAIPPDAAVGLLALAACAPDAMRVALAASRGDVTALADAERGTVGAGHRQVGRYLLHLWAVPGVLAPDQGHAWPGPVPPMGAHAAALRELAALARASVAPGLRPDLVPRP